MWYGGGNTYFRGLAILDSLGVTSFKALPNDPLVYDGVSDTEKYDWMSEGFIDTTKSTSVDGSMMIASGPYSLAPGDSLISTWAYIGANNLSNLLTFTDRAKSKADLLKVVCTHRVGDVTGDGKVLLPDIVFLINYLFRSGAAPNPFCRGDANFDSTIQLTDIVYIVNFIFRSGVPPIPHDQCCLGT
jgi:hypothetical protein